MAERETAEEFLNSLGISVDVVGEDGTTRPAAPGEVPREVKREVKQAARKGLKKAQKIAEKTTKKVTKNELKRLPRSDEELKKALYDCFLMARRGKTGTDDEAKFEAFWMENLEQLWLDIVNRRYYPSRGKAFITDAPVIREIFAAPFRDRIVHHFLYAVVAPWWDKQFIYDSYSCRNFKGTDFGVQRLQAAIRKASRNGQERAYVIKGDLSGYFMSLSRELLFKKVAWGLRKQFPGGGWLHDVCLFLWKRIIFDDPCKDVRIAGRREQWKKLPLNKSLFHQPEGQGIVIGNLTSQLLSNIMLNEFDWWMKRRMGFKFYGRYVDDFYVVVTEDDLGYAKEAVIRTAPEYLADMGLKAHPKKWYVQEVRKGVPFLGKKVCLDAILPGKRFKKNVKKTVRKIVEHGDGLESLASYVGMSKNMNAKKFMKKAFEEVGGKYWY